MAWAPRYALSIFSRAAGMSEHGKPTLPPAGPDKEAFLACFRLGGDHVRAVAAHTALQSRIAGAAALLGLLLVLRRPSLAPREEVLATERERRWRRPFETAQGLSSSHRAFDFLIKTEAAAPAIRNCRPRARPPDATARHDPRRRE